MINNENLTKIDNNNNNNNNKSLEFMDKSSFNLEMSKINKSFNQQPFEEVDETNRKIKFNEQMIDFSEEDDENFQGKIEIQEFKKK